ncbi:MAG: carboxypeptidase regulatory-like domain-containing protein, partial [Caldilineaceae bacterium]
MKQRPFATTLLLLLWLMQSFITPLAAAPQRPAGFSETRQVLAAVHTINITDNGFSPATLTIKTGESVQWQNATSQPQTVRSGPLPRLLLPLVMSDTDSDNGVAVRRSAFVPTDQFEGHVQPGQSFSRSYNTAGEFVYHLAGSLHTGRIVVEQSNTPPPPPTDTSTAPLPMSDAAVHLYTGEDAPQKNVAENAIDPRRVVVLRGLVFDRLGHPLPGVRVTVLNAPDFGHTFSAADGTFNLALNGGGTFTVNLEKSGYLPVQRTVVDPPW